MAFSQIEPIGEARGDLRFAILDALIANSSRDTSKKSDPFSPRDFLIDFWKEEEPEEPPNDNANRQLAEMLAGIGLGTFVKEP